MEIGIVRDECELMTTNETPTELNPDSQRQIECYGVSSKTPVARCSVPEVQSPLGQAIVGPEPSVPDMLPQQCEYLWRRTDTTIKISDSADTNAIATTSGGASHGGWWMSTDLLLGAW